MGAQAASSSSAPLGSRLCHARPTPPGRRGHWHHEQLWLAHMRCRKWALGLGDKIAQAGEKNPQENPGPTIERYAKNPKKKKAH